MDNSPFGTLPPELRNEIYKLVFSGAEIHIWTKSCGSKTPASVRWSGSHQRQVRSLALASTCKQIRQESMPLFYGINEFSFHNVDILKAFLAMIGERNAYALPNVEITSFVRPRIIFRGPATGTKAARSRFETLYSLAKSYGWKSAAVCARFEGYCRVQVSFDVVDLSEPWMSRRYGVDMAVEERFFGPHTGSRGRELQQRDYEGARRLEGHPHQASASRQHSQIGGQSILEQGRGVA